MADVYGRPVVVRGPLACRLGLQCGHAAQNYLLPAGASLLLANAGSASGAGAVAKLASRCGGYDVVLLDPPWPNSSARNRAAYTSMDMEGLLRIPVQHMLRSTAPDAITAVWVTNSPRVERFVVDTLFPAWGLREHCRWLWLKVTAHGEPIFRLDSANRVPYEQLIVGVPAGAATEFPAEPLVLVSVPDLVRGCAGCADLSVALAQAGAASRV